MAGEGFLYSDPQALGSSISLNPGGRCLERFAAKKKKRSSGLFSLRAFCHCFLQAGPVLSWSANCVRDTEQSKCTHFPWPLAVPFPGTALPGRLTISPSSQEHKAAAVLHWHSTGHCRATTQHSSISGTSLPPMPSPTETSEREKVSHTENVAFIKTERLEGDMLFKMSAVRVNLPQQAQVWVTSLGKVESGCGDSELVKEGSLQSTLLDMFCWEQCSACDWKSVGVWETEKRLWGTSGIRYCFSSNYYYFLIHLVFKAALPSQKKRSALQQYCCKSQLMHVHGSLRKFLERKLPSQGWEKPHNFMLAQCEKQTEEFIGSAICSDLTASYMELRMLLS